MPMVSHHRRDFGLLKTTFTIGDYSASTRDFYAYRVWAPVTYGHPSGGFGKHSWEPSLCRNNVAEVSLPSQRHHVLLYWPSWPRKGSALHVAEHRMKASILLSSWSGGEDEDAIAETRSALWSWSCSDDPRIQGRLWAYRHDLKAFIAY